MNGTDLHNFIRDELGYIKGKLDKIDDKLDTKADKEEVSGLRERVRKNERDVKGIKTKVSLVSAFIGASVSWLGSHFNPFSGS